MDDRQFDQLARGWGRLPRRGVLLGLGAVALGGAAIVATETAPDAAAKACGRHKRRCHGKCIHKGKKCKKPGFGDGTCTPGVNTCQQPTRECGNACLCLVSADSGDTVCASTRKFSQSCNQTPCTTDAECTSCLGAPAICAAGGPDCNIVNNSANFCILAACAS